MQVSSSKKWNSKPALNADGKPLLQKNGKPVLRKSYSVLQDDFFNYMKAAGYTDLERGERGSSEEHLTVTQFKVEREQERLQVLESSIEKKEATLEKVSEKLKQAKADMLMISEIEQMGKPMLSGKIQFTEKEAAQLKALAKEGVSSRIKINDIQSALLSARHDSSVWKSRYEKVKAELDALKEKVGSYLTALEKAPELVSRFIERVLNETRKREVPQPEYTKLFRKGEIEK